MNNYTEVNVRVTGQALQLASVPLIASGGINSVKVIFTFDSLWDGMAKTAVFYTDPKQAVQVLLTDDWAVVPSEILGKDGTFSLGVFGTNEEQVLPSALVELSINKGAASLQPVDPAEPTPDIYSQIMSAYAVLKARMDALVTMKGIGAEYGTVSDAHVNGIFKSNGYSAFLNFTISGLSLAAGDRHYTDYFLSANRAPLSTVEMETSDPALKVTIEAPTAEGLSRVLIENISSTDYAADKFTIVTAFYPLANTGNTEVTDLRVGYDNTVYPTAAEAVRTQFSKIAADAAEQRMTHFMITYDEETDTWICSTPYIGLQNRLATHRLQSLVMVKGHTFCSVDRVESDPDDGVNALDLYTEWGVFRFSSDESIVKIAEPESGGTVKTVNGISPDENGNVEIPTGGGPAEGAVLYTEQDLTPEQQAQARENIGAADKETVDGIKNDLGEVTTLTSDNFVQGMLEVGTGIKDTLYFISTANPIPITVGEKIVIEPNGLAPTYFIESVDDFANVVTHLEGATCTENTEIISKHNGFLFVMVRHPAGQAISPSGYVCNITIGSSRLNDMEEQIGLINDKADNLKSSIDKIMYASAKHKPFTRIINNCQNANDWIIQNNSADMVSVDTTNFITGTQSLRSDKQLRCVKHKYDMLNNDIVVKYRINSATDGAELRLNIGTNAAPSVRANYILSKGAVAEPTEWKEAVIPFAAYTLNSATEPNYSAIDDLMFLSVNGTVDFNLQYVGLRPRRLEKGIITFTFDDCWKSQYTGVKILAGKGITSTLFTIKEGIGNDICLSLEELQELVNYYGADIEVHGATAYDTWTDDALKSHWADSQAYFKANGLGEGKHMAYPEGVHPDNVVQLARGYFDSCRTIEGLIPFESYPPGDRYRVRSVTGVGASSGNVTTVKNYIDKATASGAWLILVFHKIEDGGNSGMYCSEANLREIADYAINSGAHIMNYAEVFDSGILK